MASSGGGQHDHSFCVVKAGINGDGWYDHTVYVVRSFWSTKCCFYGEFQSYNFTNKVSGVRWWGENLLESLGSNQLNLFLNRHPRKKALFHHPKPKLKNKCQTQKYILTTSRLFLYLFSRLPLSFYGSIMSNNCWLHFLTQGRIYLINAILGFIVWSNILQQGSRGRREQSILGSSN